ncbi:MAG: Nif3-like dinuclear metal center hexameric protein [Prevotellaceae bacterium]|jgi:dinuclear metal center YbgI/SA1388 family protein|nr:Nif3-like dinuclear metal center hexameric protein [Prevotellaceae bacterium]
MQAKDIALIIEELAPLKCQEDYDNAGFSVGLPSSEVKGVLLCVDVTEEIIDEAITVSTNMIISHHPVIFSGLKHIIGDNYVERIVAKALKHDLILYAAHTNLDNVPYGVNWTIAQQLGLQNIQILTPLNSDPQAGTGVVGNLPVPMHVEHWLALLKQHFTIPHLRHNRLPKPEVRRIAICGGSGAFLIDAAVAAGADCFISADFKYHNFFDVDGRLLIVDAGHYETEKCVLSIFFDLLTKKMPNFAVRITGKISNPVIYC